MSAQYFNSFRSNKPLTEKNYGNRSTSKSISQSQTGKRGRLRKLIQEKIMKKYNLTASLDFIENEIDTFIGCDNLSDKDLKILDNRINGILKDKGLISNSSFNRVSKSQDKKNNYSSVLSNNNSNNINIVNNEKTTNADNNSNTIINNEELNSNNANLEPNTNPLHPNTQRNVMSGASNLSEMFSNENKGTKNRNDPYVPGEELIKPKKKAHRFEYEHEEDMWNAFNNVNRRLFEQERIEEKLKDHEIKRRTKEDLDNQIKQKLLRLDQERKKNSEYHDILVKHIDHMNLLEEQKQARIRAKILKEKENRDKQMWDQNYRKKVEKIKLRKYENQLLSYIGQEIQNDKDNYVKKKIEAKEQLKKTLEENEMNKIQKEKLRQEEVEDDIRCAEENNKILEKQENDRRNYFKNIELKSTDFMAKMTDTVLKDLKDKNDKAEKRMNDFLKQRDDQAIENEKLSLMQKKQDKKELKKFLDSQVEEKKKLAMFEKEIDEEQARIIKVDKELYEDYKRDANEKIKAMNMSNCKYLKEQIDTKQAAKDYAKMSKLKYLRDKDL